MESDSCLGISIEVFVVLHDPLSTFSSVVSFGVCMVNAINGAIAWQLDSDDRGKMGCRILALPYIAPIPESINT